MSTSLTMISVVRAMRPGQQQEYGQGIEYGSHVKRGSAPINCQADHAYRYIPLSSSFDM